MAPRSCDLEGCRRSRQDRDKIAGSARQACRESGQIEREIEGKQQQLHVVSLACNSLCVELFSNLEGNLLFGGKSIV